MGEPATLARRFDGWIPLRAACEKELAVDWCYTGALEFTDPFFADTISRAFRRPFALMCQRRTTAAQLKGICETSSLLQPRGFIFHMSRCGSTLVSRTLAALPELLVLSEPPPLDDVLRKSACDEHIRLIVSALARRRRDAQQGLIVKLDCWNTLEIPRFRRLFPDVPFIFIFREPADVLVSQLNRPGAWTLPDTVSPETFGMDPGAAAAMRRDEYCVRALAAICAAGARAARAGDILPVNYSELPEAIFTRIAPHFGLQLNEVQRSVLRFETRFNAKQPGIFFERDIEWKRKAATPRIRELTDQWCGDSYVCLNAFVNRPADEIPERLY